MAKKQNLPGTVFTLEEIQLILDGCSKTCLSGVRNRALLAIMFGSGLRISEAINLFKSDIDLVGKTVLVRRGKNGEFRRVALLPAMIPCLEKWIAKREAELGLNGKHPLFCTHTKG